MNNVARIALGPVNAIGMGHVVVPGRQMAVRGAAAGWPPVQVALAAGHGNPEGRA